MPKTPTIPLIVTCENCGQLFYNVSVEEFTKTSTGSHRVYQGGYVDPVTARPTVGNRCPTCGVCAPRLEPAPGIPPAHSSPAAWTGCVYVLLNPHMQGLVKIGKTSRDANLRAAELSQHTGVPADFIVVFQQEVTDCDAVERLVHEQLSQYRLPGKEFFKLPVADAIRVLIDVSGKFRPN